MIFFISLLLFISPIWAAPEACSEIDLTQNPGAPLAEIPRWSQGHSHLCYAFAAASLIDNYRFTHGDKDRSHLTSPLLLSLKTMEQFQEAGSSLAGGRVEHAFAAAKIVGSCGVQNISDKMGPFSTDLILKTFTQEHQNFQKYPDKKTEVAENILQFLKISKIKNEDLPDLAEIEKNLSLSPSRFLASTLLNYCGEVKKLEDLPTPKLLFQPDASSDEILRKIEEMLQAKTPVGINYCANVVTDPDHQGALRDQKWICHKNKNHSAIVVGRKSVNGSCHFLIRDSGCEGYKQAPQRCLQGQYCVEARPLARNLHGIFWLD